MQMWLYLLIHVAASLEIDGGHVQQETTNKFIVLKNTQDKTHDTRFFWTNFGPQIDNINIHKPRYVSVVST